MRRREFVLGSLGVAVLGGGAMAADAAAIRAARQAIGQRESIAGTVVVTVMGNDEDVSAYGSSGVPDVAMDSDTVFEIGSITKVLTALILADMVQRGEVGLDDPVSDYLPAGATPGVRGRPITLLDLATYTSGLPGMPGNMPPGWQTAENPLAGYTTDMMFAFLGDFTPSHEPGAHYEYANLGFALLGAALARRAGTSFEALLIERVCDPLGLDHTRITLTPEMQAHAARGWNLDVRPAPFWDMPGLQGAGAVRSTAADCAMFLKACMGPEPTPLSDSLAMLRSVRRPTPLAGTEAALGWFISSSDREEIVWKTGVTGGCNTFLGFSTRQRRGAVVLSNFLSWPEGGGPVDGTVFNIGAGLINPDFDPGDLTAIYR